MKLRTKLSSVERSLFVGREKELKMMERHAADNWKWQWLHIYGQSGMGKSTLLQQYISKQESAHIYFIDGSKTIFQKEDILSQLAEQIKMSGEYDSVEIDPQTIAKQMTFRAYLDNCPIVLLIDGFENLRAVENWLPHWLGQLEDSIKIITAGRHPLTGGWLRSGWASMIYSVELSALSPVEVGQYANKRGVSSSDSRSHLFGFSRGIPLAMTLAAETMLRGQHEKPFDREEQFELIGVLMAELLDELPSSVRRLFEAASVFWRFNEERISAVLDEEIDSQSFRKLTSMPFVDLKENSWQIHDAVRSWALEDLILRKPQTFEQMRQRALKHIRLEEHQNPQLRSNLHIDKMSLHESPLVRNLCFSGHLDAVEIRECRECDLPAIQSLYTRYHQFVSPLPPGEQLMEKLIAPVWQVDPSSFTTFWKANELIAFYGKIPLHAEMHKVLKKEPLLRPFLRNWQPAPKSYLLTFIGIEPELEEKSRAFIMNSLMNHFYLSEWILDFTCLEEWFPLFEMLGFERAAWADATTEYGIEFRAFILDLTQEDYLTKLERCLSNAPLPAEAMVEKDPSKNLTELKSILKDLSRLSKKPALVEKYAQLFPHRIALDKDLKKAENQIQQDLTNLINRLAEGDNQDATLGKLLKSAYIQGVRPHERVAEKYNISMATYYRYLNKALELLYTSCQQ